MGRLHEGRQGFRAKHFWLQAQETTPLISSNIAGANPVLADMGRPDSQVTTDLAR